MCFSLMQAANKGFADALNKVTWELHVLVLAAMI